MVEVRDLSNKINEMSFIKKSETVRHTGNT